MFPIEGNKSRININLGVYLRDRRLFSDGHNPNFASFNQHMQSLNREDLVYHYTHGMCGILATVLHQLLGWPVAAVYRGPTRLKDFIHIGVFNPQTLLYTDVRGSEQTRKQFMWKYPAICYGRCSVLITEDIDYFIPDQDENNMYSMCLLEHVPKLFPQYAEQIQEIKGKYNV